MPFFKQPPNTVINAYIADLKNSGINQNPNTVEQDLDRIMFAYQQNLMLDEATKKLPPEIAARLSNKSEVDPLAQIIVSISKKHFSSYYK